MVLCWAELVERAEVFLMVLVVLAGEKKDTTMLRENTPTNSNIKHREKIEVELWMAINAVGVVAISQHQQQQYCCCWCWLCIGQNRFSRLK